jgi:signal transduction histidine kinase
MWEILKNVVSPSQYIPHGHCYLWQTPLVWLHIVSDLLIAIAYFSIPAMLIYFIHKRRDVPFQGIFALFGAFIILCGTGHLLEIWTLWHPTYWLTGSEKALTALVSCYTAAQMVTLLPQFLSLKTPEQLEAINGKLQHEIVERQQAEQILQRIVAGTASVTGEAFFPALVQNLAKALDVRQVFVAEVASEFTVRSAIRVNVGDSDSDRTVASEVLAAATLGTSAFSVRTAGCASVQGAAVLQELASRQGESDRAKKNLKTLAFWSQSKRENNPESDTEDTFCKADVQLRQGGNPSQRVQEDFSRAERLEARSAAYHCSVPLLDDQQQEIGILGIIHDQSLASEENAKAIMKVFAVRASAELQRQKVELALRRAYEELEVRVRERTADLVESNTALEAEIRERVAAQEALSQQLKREQLVGTMLDRIRSSLNLEDVLQTAVDEVQRFLQTDRTIIYRFTPDWSGFVAVESVGKDGMPMLGVDIQDECFKERYVSLYQQGRIRAIADIHNSDLNPCHVKLLSQFQVKANLVIPILESEETIPNPQSQIPNRLWGLLIAHHCTEPRQWQEFEIECLKQLSVQLAIALQQCTLFAQARTELAERKQAEAALRRSEARERKKAQELEVTLHQLRNTQAQIVQSEKMASLGQMVAGVAHEINNPTSFIYGNINFAINYANDLLDLLELYQQHYPQPPAAIEEQIQTIDLNFLKDDFIKLLESMKTGADRISEIVLALRNFSRLDEAERKAADLNQGIESTLMILQHRLKPQSPRPVIEVIKDYGKLPLVQCYPGQLNQVFMNLLINAIDALEEESEKDINFVPQIRICTEVRENPEKSHIKSIIIRIADNGAGISETVKRRIFDPFYTTKPVGQGTGLGLSISYQIIVEKHKGRLECSSQLGEGTEFVIELHG